MPIPTDEQKTQLEKKFEHIELKAQLLKKYKSYEQNLEYADDEFEKSLIMQKRDKLATRIRGLGAMIRELESLENQA